MNRNADPLRCGTVFGAGGGNRAIWDTIYLRGAGSREYKAAPTLQYTDAQGQQDIYTQYFCHALFILGVGFPIYR